MAAAASYGGVLKVTTEIGETLYEGMNSHPERGEKSAECDLVILSGTKWSERIRRERLLNSTMKIYQQPLTLSRKKRGFHIVTDEIENILRKDFSITTGICHIFIMHTSASLSINENADSTVRKDFETWFNKAVPENDPDYRHNTEGVDDMPAHIKASLLGSSVTIPVSNGRLALGTWQGVYLCEHRDHGEAREIVVTVIGE